MENIRVGANAPLAQIVEHYPFKVGVIGAKPIRRTICLCNPLKRRDRL